MSIPIGVLGGATIVLYGLIAVLGGRIWVENKVDFKNPVNLFPAAIGLIIGAANFTWTSSSGHGDMSFNGIAIGAFATIIIYHVMNLIQKYGPLQGTLFARRDRSGTPRRRRRAPTAGPCSRRPRSRRSDVKVPDHVPEHFGKRNPSRPGSKTLTPATATRRERRRVAVGQDRIHHQPIHNPGKEPEHMLLESPRRSRRTTSTSTSVRSNRCCRHRPMGMAPWPGASIALKDGRTMYIREATLAEAPAADELHEAGHGRRPRLLRRRRRPRLRRARRLVPQPA